MRDDDIPVLPGEVSLREDKVRQAWVLLAPQRAVTLDAVGLAVLNEIDGTRSFGEITQALAARYDAPLAQIREDSRGFLDALADRRFLHITP